MTPTLLSDLQKFSANLSRLIAAVENSAEGASFGEPLPPQIPPPSGPRDAEAYIAAANLRDELIRATGINALDERFKEFVDRLDEIHHLNGYKRALSTWKTALQPFMVRAIIKRG